MIIKTSLCLLVGNYFRRTCYVFGRSFSELNDLSPVSPIHLCASARKACLYEI